MKQTFTEKVFAVVKKIPRGKVLTYQEVARRAGSPRAFRAVGTILSNNYNLTVPCHRVVRSDGGMGGYNRGGIAKKRALLKKEGYTIAMKKGFTLVEIMVAVFIVALLATIVFANVNEGRKRARDAVRIRDLQQIAKALDSYYIQNSTFSPHFNDASISSFEDIKWDNFMTSLGLNSFHDPHEGLNHNGVSAFSVACADNTHIVSGINVCQYIQFNYFMLNRHGSSIAGGGITQTLTPPLVYAQLEKEKKICETGLDDPPGCSPQCVGGLTPVGPVGITNCTDLSRGCVLYDPEGPSNGFGSNPWVCIPFGPLAP